MMMKDMISNRRGQVTVFIIIGVIILVSAALFVYTRTTVVRPAGVGEKISEIPVEFQPVSSFVDYCLIKTTEDGLELLGDKAGYIYPEKYGIVFSDDSTESDGIRMPGLDIPYWYYMKSPNDCREVCNFKFGAPTIEQMQEQLEDYIEENLNLCLNDFEDLKAEGYDFAVNESPVATVDMENEVMVTLDYKFSVKKTGTAKLDRFYITIPLDLKKIYNLGLHITNKEAQEHYLELQTLNLIAGFSSIDNEKLPPMADSEFKFGRGTMWLKSSVEENLKNIITGYVQFIQLYPSLNYRAYSGTQMQQDLYNGMVVPSEEEYAGYETRFSYMDFSNMYFDLNCNGEICKPDELTITIIPTGFKRYNFVYDVSYPAIVEINEPDALNGRGYDFRFGLEANVRDNAIFAPESVSFEPVGAGESDFCNYLTMNSGEITIKAVDAKNKNAIENAGILYSCGTESCTLESTDDLGMAKQNFPICFGGSLSVLKDGYVGKILPLSTDVGKEEDIIVELIPKVDVKVEVKKLRMVKSRTAFYTGWYLERNPIALGNEEATIMLTRKGDDEGFTSAASFKPGEEATISLAEGSYDVDIRLVSYDKVIIPPTTVEYGPFWDEEEVDLPGIEFNSSNPYVSGAVLEDDSPNYVWGIGKNVYNAEKVVFYVIYPDPRTMEDIRDYDAGAFEDYSKNYRTAIEPRFE